MSKTTITWTPTGPYLVRGGDFELVDSEGNPVDRGKMSGVALCRCGMSANKPFCDGAHSKCGFDGSQGTYSAT